MLKPNENHTCSNDEPTRFDKIVSIIMNFNLTKYIHNNNHLPYTHYKDI